MKARPYYPKNSINMANILMRGFITWILLFHVVSPVDSTRGFHVEDPTCTIAMSSTLESLRRLQTLMRLYDLAERLSKGRKRKARLGREKEICRITNAGNESTGMSGSVNWVPNDFYTHHRMRRVTFEKLLSKLGDSLYTETSKVRYGSGSGPRECNSQCD